jgi:outer membrane protein TolC
MNERVKSGWLGAALLALTAATLGGCGFPSEKPYLKMRVPQERLRTVEPLDWRAMSLPEEAEAPEQAAPGDAAGGPNVSLDLQECRASALRNNLDLQVALIAPAAAQEALTEARAQFAPTLFADYLYSKTDMPISTTLKASKSQTTSGDLGVSFPLRTGGTLTFDSSATRFRMEGATPGTLNPSYTADATASITQPLLRGGGVRTATYGIRVGHYQQQSSEAEAKLRVTRLIAEADRAYWRLYAARRVLEVRKEEYDLAVSQLERARRRVDAGMSSEIEIIRAEAGVSERVESVIISENSVRASERELKRLLNRPGLAVDGAQVIVPVTEPQPVRYALDVEKLIAAALENRMELLELELQLAQEADTVLLRRNEMLPDLTASYTYRRNGLGKSFEDAYEVVGENDFADYGIGLGLSVPLGNRAARSRLRQAKYSQAQTRIERAARELLIRQEVLDAVDQLEAGWQRVLANRQRSILAARTLEAEVRQFEHGLRTSTDVLDAQAKLADAQSAEIGSLVEYEIAQANLAQATGTVLGAAHVEWEPITPGAQ